MKATDIGVDIVDIPRFRKANMRRGARFVRNTFSEHERGHCFSHRDPAPHLAGTFAAKEAVRKIYGEEPMLFSNIEVRRRTSGKPEIWINGKRSRTVLVSISHNATTAIAIALKHS